MVVHTAASTRLLAFNSPLHGCKVLGYLVLDLTNGTATSPGAMAPFHGHEALLCSVLGLINGGAHRHFPQAASLY